MESMFKMLWNSCEGIFGTTTQKRPGPLAARGILIMLIMGMRLWLETSCSHEPMCHNLGSKVFQPLRSPWDFKPPSLSPFPLYGLRLCYWVEEPNCFSFVLQDSILSVGLQPPKPQLAAQSACLEECEGLLMVTPSLAVLGARSQATLPHSFSFLSFSQTCSQTNK